MSFTRLMMVQFGPGYTGLVGTIGYTIINPDNTVNVARTTSNITERPIGSGNYAVSVTFTAGFVGEIRWDTGGGSPKYASEDVSDTLYDRTNFKLSNDGLDQILIAGKTLSNSIRYISAAVSGKSTGAGSGMETYQDHAGVDAFIVIIDTVGNRTGTTYL